MALSKTMVMNSQSQSRLPINDELTRIASYLNWPESAEVRPSALSRHGFIYEGQGDRTRCVACGIVVDNWQRGDRPPDVHRNMSPRCPFVIADSHSGLDTGDAGSRFQSTQSQLQRLSANEPRTSTHNDSARPVPTTLPTSSSSATTSAAAPSVQQTAPSSGVSRNPPDFNQLRSESSRLSTFHDWPSSAGRIVEPRDLAAVGLFYTGYADRVQCAFCRGCLRSWRPGDRPDVEHRRHFPDCPLMREAATRNTPSDSPAVIDPHPTTGEYRAQFTTGELVPKSGTGETSGSGGVGNSTGVAGNVSASPVATAAAAALAAPPAADEREMDDECRAEMEENRRLREARTCKVCLDREVNTVFLPCGHLVCCDTCSPALRNCAICRALIRGTVKVFLG